MFIINKIKLCLRQYVRPIVLSCSIAAMSATVITGSCGVKA